MRIWGFCVRSFVQIYIRSIRSWEKETGQTKNAWFGTSPGESHWSFGSAGSVGVWVPLRTRIRRTSTQTNAEPRRRVRRADTMQNGRAFRTTFTIKISRLYRNESMKKKTLFPAPYSRSFGPSLSLSLSFVSTLFDIFRWSRERASYRESVRVCVLKL